MIKSLHARQHELAHREKQVAFLDAGIFSDGTLPRFESKISQAGAGALAPGAIEIFQVNIGYMCNQVCKHCHVDAGPDRKEIMTRETMQWCLEALSRAGIQTLDITGGAPEMNPDFLWFVEQAHQMGVKEIIVRSNLTIILQILSITTCPSFSRRTTSV